MKTPTLVIGNKNYSSWSLRPWFLLKETDIEFNEIKLKLFTDEYQQIIADYSPTRQVPVLRHNEHIIWDSLSIAEYLNETYPTKQMWPKDVEARILARSVSCEMHSGFSALRNFMPMNCRAKDRKIVMTDELQADIDRVIQIWTECREKFAEFGPWLFGNFSIADAMYAPVVFRFLSYGVFVENAAKDYLNFMKERPALITWKQEGIAEKEVIEYGEVGISEK